MPILADAGAGCVAVRPAVHINGEQAIVRKRIGWVGLISVIIARAAGHGCTSRWAKQTCIHRRRSTTTVDSSFANHIIGAVRLLQQI
jgi:hypothetical protein